jgi:hypothetical protein
MSIVILAAVLVAAVVARLILPPNWGQASETKPAKSDDGGMGVAVVELFTSEGCSSCPPADALLAEAVQDARKHGRPVYCLAFQVDYWNQLGWTDPFSDAAYSRRQNDYAAALGANQVYTPQMIVNGTDAFVGSDREHPRQSIDGALRRPAAVQLKLSAEKGDAGAVVVSYIASQAPKGAVLNVAVVDRGLVSKATRGENSGRTLHHENVVRAFRTIRLDESGKGSVVLKPPAGLVQENASAIAYVQKADAGAVLGASAVDLAPADSK